MNDSLLSRVSKLYYTVKMLRFEQIFYRVYYRYAKVKPLVGGDASVRSEFSLLDVRCSVAARFTDDGQFDFMGIRGEIDWSSRSVPKLWLYNLHYLDLLNCSAVHPSANGGGQLVNRWIEGNPPFAGCGWEPYPLSLRIVNFVKWMCRQESLEDAWLNSLAAQAHALSQQIEYHILGNHLFVNGKALVFAGSYLQGSHADRWLRQGLEILDREVKEQFLADGAHFELSPMYHASLMWDMCDLVNLASRSDLVSLKTRLSYWKEVVARGVGWMKSMQHPDGDISFFNDAALGIAPHAEDILAYAQQLGCVVPNAGDVEQGVSVKWNPESGYAVIELDDGGKAILDIASVGPDYQPGHGHADTLSFELSLFGRRLFVNSGTSQYGEGAERHRQRGTAAHSVVEVDGENSSEVWAGFRVGRRARATLDAFEREGDAIRIKARHDGYRRLKGRNVHERQWEARAGQLNVSDRITGDYGRAVARLFVHPDVLLKQDGTRVVATLPGGRAVEVCIAGADKVDVVASTWHPEFGASVKNRCIEAEFSSGTLVTTIIW